MNQLSLCRLKLFYEDFLTPDIGVQSDNTTRLSVVTGIHSGRRPRG